MKRRTILLGWVGALALVSPAASPRVAAAAPPPSEGEYTVSTFTGGHMEPPDGAVVQIAAGQDDALREVTLPFEFPYFGRLQSKVSVSSNGWLGFGTVPSSAAGVSSNPALPSSDVPNGIVAALWDDLTTGAAGSVRTFTLGSAPTRSFVVAWDHVDTFSGASDSDLSFQVVLYEGTGVVEIAYAAGGTWDGLSYTAGIEDPTGLIAFGGTGTGNGNAGQPSADVRFTPRRATFSGFFHRDLLVADATGLGNSTISGLPVQTTDLRVVREDTGEVAARGRTALDGSFSIDVLGADSPVTFAIDLLTSGPAGRTVDLSGNVYTYRSHTGLSASGAAGVNANVDGSVDASNPAIRRALIVYQTARGMLEVAADHAAAAVSGTTTSAETIPPIDLRWAPGAASPFGRTIYVPAAGATPAVIHVHDGADNPDPWDQDVVGREYAHHILATISVHPGQVTSRSFAAATNAPFAWADGFATWYVCAVQGRPQFFDTKSATVADVFDLETPVLSSPAGPTVTGAVAATLWDFSDTDAAEPFDGIAGTTGLSPSSQASIFAVADLAMDALPQGVAAFDVGRFLDAWHAADSAPADDEIARVAIVNGSRPDDAFELNDRSGEESVSVARRIDGLTLTPHNEDRFRFTLDLDGTQTLSAVVSQTGTTDLDVEVSLVGGGVVASATNVGAATKTQVTATTTSPAVAGTYEVRVIWRAGAAANWSLAVFDALRVVRTTLPDWTVGEPFKEDLTAAGGVAPYTFTTTASIPGLSVTESGVRLTGTPTAEGDHAVAVSVADASGTGNAASSSLALRVNARPSVPPIFAAVADAPVDAVIGRGGTAATWFEGTAPPAGFDLTGGESLTLSGAAASARTFVVSGSAEDAVGAVLGDTPCNVVLCDPLEGPESGAAAGRYFGYWFDAVEGATLRVRFRFRGTGANPVVAAVLDDRGSALDLADAVTQSGRTVRVDGVEILRSGLHFVVFDRGTGAFAGDVSSRGGAVAPRRLHGVVVIDPAGAVPGADLPLGAGSSARVTLRSGPVPIPVRPQLFGLLDPEGGSLPVPARSVSRDGRLVRHDPFTAETTGVHVLRIAGDSERTGPVFWQARIRVPR